VKAVTMAMSDENRLASLLKHVAMPRNFLMRQKKRSISRQHLSSHRLNSLNELGQ
jgi:hypothetical protein